MLKRRFKKFNNKAFTLVEIMFAVALLALASIAIGSMLISTQNSTTQMFSESELQQQVVQAQQTLHNEIISTSVGIKYWTRASSGSNFQLVLKDNGEEYEKLIAFYNIDTKDYTLMKKYYKWNSSDRTLWFVEVEETLPKNRVDKTILKIDENVDVTLSTINKWSLVAANIDSISFDLSHCKDNDLISYSVVVEQDDVEYPTNDIVRVRNDIYVNDVEMVLGEYHTVTLKRPTLAIPTFIYDGTIKTPEVNDYYDRFMYRVEGDGNTYSAKNAGTYKVTYRLKDPDATQWEGGGTDDITLTWTIQKRKVEMVWGQTNWVYDGDEHSTTCTFTNIVQGDVCEPVLTGNKIGPNVGSNPCTVEVSSGDNYYVANDEKTVTLEITRATPVVTIRLVNRVYNTQPQSMVSYSNVVGGNIRFYISQNDVDPNPDDVDWSEICEATNAGDYYIWYKILADGSGNYKNTEVIKLGKAVMNKAPGSVIAPTAKTLTYNRNPQALINPGSTPYGVVEYKVGNGEWDTTVPSETNARTYRVYYYSTGNANYEPTSKEAYVDVTINQAMPNPIDLEKLNPTYDTTWQDMVSHSGAVGGEIKFYISTNSSTPSADEVSGNDCKAMDAGTYYIWYKIVAEPGENYKDNVVVSLGTVVMNRKPAAYVDQVNATNYHISNNIRNGYVDYEHVDLDLNTTASGYTTAMSASAPGKYIFYATPSANYEWTTGGVDKIGFTWEITPHEYDPWYNEINATCISEGQARRVCVYNGCGYSETKTIGINNNHVNIVYGGYAGSHLECASCNTVVSVAHNLVRSVLRDATCTQTGQAMESCVCGYSYTKIIDKKSHVYSYSQEYRGCSYRDRIMRATCKNCSDTYTYSQGPIMSCVNNRGYCEYCGRDMSQG